MKVYERTATCEHNENIDDILMRVSIGENLCKRILKLAHVAGVIEVEEIRDFNADSEWFEIIYNDDFDEKIGHQLDWDSCMIIVSRWNVSWERRHNHITHESAPISITQLREDFSNE